MRAKPVRVPRLHNAEGRHWSRHLGRVAVGLSLVLCVLLRIRSSGRIAAALWPETLVISTVVGFTQVIRYPKINIDLTGAFISAAATPGEVAVVTFRTIGACLKRQIRFPVMRLDYPLLGVATAFLFDREFE